MMCTRKFAASLFGAALVVGLVSTASAQQRPVGPVAILDLEYIFKHHARLESLKQQMQGDVQAAEHNVQKARQSLQELAKKLDDYKKGTPEFKNLEEELAKRDADIKLQVNVQRRNFAEQQSKIFYSIYQQVAEAVKQYSQQNGIQLVMRFNGDQPDPTDPDDIVRALNKSVVYNAPEIDITPAILRMVNAQSPAPPVPGGVAPQPYSTPGPAGGNQPINPGPANNLRPGVPPKKF